MRKRFIVAASLVAAIASTTKADVISPESHIALAPDIALNANGDIAIMWVDRAPEFRGEHENHDRHLSYTDLFVSVSKDGGVTFGDPVKVNHGAGVVWGQSVSRPRIVGSVDGLSLIHI